MPCVNIVTSVMKHCIVRHVSICARVRWKFCTTWHVWIWARVRWKSVPIHYLSIFTRVRWNAALCTMAWKGYVSGVGWNFIRNATCQYEHMSHENFQCPTSLYGHVLVDSGSEMSIGTWVSSSFVEYTTRLCEPVFNNLLYAMRCVKLEPLKLSL